MAVSVVNSYAATPLFVFVTFDRNVDLPTEGKPTRAMRASPDLVTSKPVPAPAEEPGVGSRSWARRRASLPLRRPRWYSVALFSGGVRLCGGVVDKYFGCGAFHLRSWEASVSYNREKG
jgi:hypothetical protein